MKVTDKYKTETFPEDPPYELRLIEKQADIWLISLETDKNTVDKLEAVLSEDELIKARRLYSVDQTKRYIASRGFLRLILSRYLKVNPEKIRFQYDSYGKPSLINALKGNGIGFNLSHSQGKALYGIYLNKSIGVDIEKIRSDISPEKIARRQFTRLELELMEKSPESEKIHAFFTLWTRKEALLKALAKGLNFSMKHFDTSLISPEPVSFFEEPFNSAGSSEWFISDMEIDGGFCGAVATEGLHNAIRLYKAGIEDFF